MLNKCRLCSKKWCRWCNSSQIWVAKIKTRCWTTCNKWEIIIKILLRISNKTWTISINSSRCLICNNNKWWINLLSSMETKTTKCQIIKICSSRRHNSQKHMVKNLRKLMVHKIMKIHHKCKTWFNKIQTNKTTWWCSQVCQIWTNSKICQCSSNLLKTDNSEMEW